MKCKNCDSDNNYLCPKLGELVCEDCGYVMVSVILEDTVSTANWSSQDGVTYTHEYWQNEADKGVLGSKITYEGFRQINNADFRKRINRLIQTQNSFKSSKDRSINNGYLECNMVLSPYLPNSNLKERVHSYYKKLFMLHVMKGFTMPVRAVALVTYVLRENGIPITIKELSDQNNVSPARVSKCARKIARYLGKPWLLHSMPIFSWSEKIAFDLKTNKNFLPDFNAVLEYIHSVVEDRDITFTKSYMAATFWITSILRKGTSFPELNQTEISNACNCSEVSLRATFRKLMVMLDMKKSDLDKLTLGQFVAGVRYG